MCGAIMEDMFFFTFIQQKSKEHRRLLHQTITCTMTEE